MSANDQRNSQPADRAKPGWTRDGTPFTATRDAARDATADNLSWMHQTNALLIPELPRVVALLIAVVAGLIAVASYWRRRRPSFLLSMRQQARHAKNGLTPKVPDIIYRDTPTVRFVDSQRIDRLRKVARLQVGSHLDVLETRIGITPRFRIALKGIDRRADLETAHISVDFGGAEVSCGPLVHEVAYNEFILPRVSRDEPRSAVFHYYENGDSLDFMRIKLRYVDAQTGTAEIDVMQVSGHWPAT